MSTVVDPHPRKENIVAASSADFTPDVQASIDRVREDVARLHAELVRYNLIVWTGGNVSGRVPRAAPVGSKPSGGSYDESGPENMILCGTNGDSSPRYPRGVRSASRRTASPAS